jgi:hypothetical protein
LDAGAILLAVHEFVEDREHLLAIRVNAFEVIAKGGFVARSFQPLVNQGLGDVYIAAQSIDRVAAQEQTIKHRRLTLRGQRIEIVFDGLSIPHNSPAPNLKYKHEPLIWQVKKCGPAEALPRTPQLRQELPFQKTPLQAFQFPEAFALLNPADPSGPLNQSSKHALVRAFRPPKNHREQRSRYLTLRFIFAFAAFVEVSR